MAKHDPSALSEAAAAFDSELATYARLGKLFIETPLSSVKHLERANQALAEIAACEERLQAAGQHLVAVLAGSRERQEQLSRDVVAHVPTLQLRNKQLQELMGELGGLAGEVAGLNQLIARKPDGDGGHVDPSAAETLDVSAKILELSERAAQVAQAARAVDLEELHTQAHSLHQKLQVIGKKLRQASGGATA